MYSLFLASHFLLKMFFFGDKSSFFSSELSDEKISQASSNLRNPNFCLLSFFQTNQRVSSATTYNCYKEYKIYSFFIYFALKKNKKREPRASRFLWLRLHQKTAAPQLYGSSSGFHKPVFMYACNIPK